MKLKDLIESVAEITRTKTKSIRRRPQASYPFTGLVIMIFEANVKYDLDETVAYMPKSFKGKSGNQFDYKVEIMSDYLNKATLKLDNYVRKMPNLMDLDIKFSSNLKDLVNELNSAIEQVEENHEKEIDVIKFSLTRVIKKEILTQKKIIDFNRQYKELINEVSTFNEMIDFLHKLFNTKVKGKDTKTILYNPNELKHKRLINETLDYKINYVKLNIPQEPIQKKRDINEGLSIKPEDREEA